MPFTDASASPSLTEAHGTCQHARHRSAASSSSSTTTAKFENFQLAPRPNRWSYSVALRTQDPHTSTAPATRSAASGSAPIAPSTPTSGFVGKARRRQTKANRRAHLELKLAQVLLRVLLQFRVDWPTRSPTASLRTSPSTPFAERCRQSAPTAASFVQKLLRHQLNQPNPTKQVASLRDLLDSRKSRGCTKVHPGAYAANHCDYSIEISPQHPSISQASSVQVSAGSGKHSQVQDAQPLTAVQPKAWSVGVSLLFFHFH